MSPTKLYVKEDEYFDQGRFQWLVSLNPVFVAPIRQLVVRHTIPKRIEVEIDVSGSTTIPPMIFKPGGMPMGTSSDNLHDVVSRGAVESETTPQSFRLCVYDTPAPLETWRQLAFKATYSHVDFREDVKVSPEMRKRFEKDGQKLGRQSARFILTVSGEIEKTGDWTRVDEPGIKLSADAQAWHDKKAKELADADKAQRQDHTIKKAVNTGADLAAGLVQTLGNIHREMKNSAAEQKALEARKGSFKTTKNLMEIFSEVYKILQKPLGQFRMSVYPDTETLEIKARCFWIEDVQGWTHAERELHCTFNFEPEEPGTTINYDYFLYEVPPGSLFANQLIRIINGWLKALCEQQA